MNTTRSTHAKVAIAIGVVLVAGVAIGIALNAVYTWFNFTAFATVAAALAVALLTVSYVTVTSSQLEVMREQLREMAETRHLEAQPLPVVTITAVELERPRFYYTPPSDEYAAIPRLHVKFRIHNYGTHPALNLLAGVSLLLQKDGEPLVLGHRAVSVLPPQQSCPEDSASPFSIHDSGDYAPAALAALRENKFNSGLTFNISVAYRNVTGGCFVSEWQYALSVANEDDFDVLSNWETNMVSFEVRFQDELREMPRIRESNKRRWRSLFRTVNQSFTDSLEGEERLALASAEVPSGFVSRMVEKSEFEKLLAAEKTGRPLPGWWND